MRYKFQHDTAEDLRDQLDSLRQEMAVLRKKLGRRGEGVYRETRHMGEEAADWMRDYAAGALPEIRDNAYRMQRSARKHPAATAGVAAAGVLVLGLAAAFFMRR